MKVAQPASMTAVQRELPVQKPHRYRIKRRIVINLLDSIMDDFDEVTCGLVEVPRRRTSVFRRLQLEKRRE